MVPAKRVTGPMQAHRAPSCPERCADAEHSTSRSFSDRGQVLGELDASRRRGSPGAMPMLRGCVATGRRAPRATRSRGARALGPRSGERSRRAGDHRRRDAEVPLHAMPGHRRRAAERAREAMPLRSGGDRARSRAVVARGPERSRRARSGEPGSRRRRMRGATLALARAVGAPRERDVAVARARAAGVEPAADRSAHHERARHVCSVLERLGDARRVRRRERRRDVLSTLHHS